MKLKLVILCVLIGLLIVSILFFMNITDVEHIPIFITVGDYVGFNLDTTVVNLGTVFPGGKAERGIVVKSAIGDVIVAHIEGIDFVSVQPSFQVVENKKGGTLAVIALVPSDQKYGNYTGDLVIKSLPSFFQKLI